MQPRIIVGGLVLSMALVAACDPESGEREMDGLLIEAPSGGGTWLGNGLEDPDVSGLDPAHGLNTGQGLSAVTGLLTTDEGRTIAKYVVECALAEGETISKNVDGDKVRLEGLLGLAPEWKGGACDQDCQEWVTACLLARTNVTGETVDIWIAGEHHDLGLGLSADYPLLEATFYGNLFQDPGAQYYCYGSEEARAVAFANGRTCTEDADAECGFTTFGSCFEPQRCIVVDGAFPTQCAEEGDAPGARYHSLSTFVSIPEGWQGW